MDFRRTSLADLARRVGDRSLSARELTTLALDHIERHDAELGAFVAVDGDAALAQAATSTSASRPARTPGRWQASRSG